MATTPSWVNPKWEDDDIFKLSKVEIDTWKTRIATTLGLRWRAPGLEANSKPFAAAVAGLEAITQDKVTKAWKAYADVVQKPPQDSSQQAAWNAQVRSLSQLSTVVSGCFLNWEAVTLLVALLYKSKHIQCTDKGRRYMSALPFQSC